MQVILRWLLAATMVAVGVAHVVEPEPFVRIVPPVLPAPRFLVYLSGLFEILGGLGLLVPWSRRFSGWGLIALYVAVFPANVYMAWSGVSPVPGVEVSPWAAWGRLPFQLVFIAWAWYAAGLGERPTRS